MRPAYEIPLEPRDLQLLGELTAIVGQVDEEMAVCVSGLIQADRPTTNAVMGSSRVADNANIWASLIRLRTKDEDILWLVEHALSEIQALSEARNDFVHAFFMAGVRRIFGFERDGERVIVWGSTEPPVARRVRNMSKVRPVAELPDVRDRAGRLSCLVAHIGYCLAPHGRDHPDKSPWLERLAPSLPPRLDTVAARKEKARQRQRGSSREKPQPRPRQGNPP